MYFYITTRLNQGYKVGITNDVEKRQQQYTTLIPNINFYLYIQTPYAEEIEKSFKHKFNDYRVINRTSSKEMKSEVYRVKIKYLLMHFMNCIHFKERSAIIADKQSPFSSREFIEDKINLYLSNYYLPYANYNAKFLHFSSVKDYSIFHHIKIGDIEVGDAEIKDRKVTKHSGKLKYIDMNLDDWQKIINLYFEHNTKISQRAFNDLVDELKITKKEEKFNGIYLFDYSSPQKLALSTISKIWFHKLKNFKILRDYSVERFSESGFTQNIKGSALLGAPQWLRFFGYQYSSYNRKFELEEVDNNDKLV